eukprot:jgi/Botrbrau1/22282/Bobra.0138s0035.1
MPSPAMVNQDAKILAVTRRANAPIHQQNAKLVDVDHLLSTMSNIANLFEQIEDGLRYTSEASETSPKWEKRLLHAPKMAQPNLSKVTHKRNLKKVLHGIRQVQEDLARIMPCVESIASNPRDGEAYTGKSRRLASVGHLDSIALDLEEMRVKLEAAETARQETLLECNSVKASVEETEAAARKLRQEVGELSGQLETAQFRADEAGERARVALEEASQDRSTAAAALARAQDAEGQLEAAKGAAAKAGAAASRHQEAVAKLTADNLVLLMRLQEVESNAEAAIRERDELRLAFTGNQGPWFQQIHAKVEERVGEALARAEQLEAQVEQMQEQHRAELAKLGRELENVEAELGSERTKLRSLETALSDLQANLARVEKDRDDKLTALEAANGSMVDTSAENRVLLASMKSMEASMREAQAGERRALHKLEEAEAHKSHLQQQSQELQGQVGALAAAVQKKEAINVQLMQRKTDVEWQLMSLISEGKAAHVSPSPARRARTPSNASFRSPTRGATTDRPSIPMSPPPPSRVRVPSGAREDLGDRGQIMGASPHGLEPGETVVARLFPRARPDQATRNGPSPCRPGTLPETGGVTTRSTPEQATMAGLAAGRTQLEQAVGSPAIARSPRGPLQKPSLSPPTGAPLPEQGTLVEPWGPNRSPSEAAGPVQSPDLVPPLMQAALTVVTCDSGAGPQRDPDLGEPECRPESPGAAPRAQSQGRARRPSTGVEAPGNVVPAPRTSRPVPPAVPPRTPPSARPNKPDARPDNQPEGQDIGTSGTSGDRVVCPWGEGFTPLKQHSIASMSSFTSFSSYGSAGMSVPNDREVTCDFTDLIPCLNVPKRTVEQALYLHVEKGHLCFDHKPGTLRHSRSTASSLMSIGNSSQSSRSIENRGSAPSLVQLAEDGGSSGSEALAAESRMPSRRQSFDSSSEVPSWGEDPRYSGVGAENSTSDIDRSNSGHPWSLPPLSEEFEDCCLP